MDQPGGFRVIIVGGSIAGLTLAHCLKRANIDHVVLEKGKTIAPQLGASIGIMPNGGRILQQLGLSDQVLELVEPLTVANVTYPDGFVFRSEFPRLLHQRFGFPLAFLDRQMLLDILFKAYSDKSKIVTGARVSEVRRSGHGVCVVTEDGRRYQGDLVVGADGVHSRVRSEMWWFAEAESGKTFRQEKAGMTVEYACIFGISIGLPSLEPGEQINTLRKGLTIATIHGKKGRIFWFIVKKLDQRYKYPNVPRFSSDDAATTCAQLADIHIWKGVHVRDLWKTRVVVSMTALEEFALKTWHYDRMVLLGDSVHKMTPNFGQGANCAIEDAAVLASLLYDLVNVHGGRRQSDQEVNRVLEKYYSQRYSRIKRVCKMSWFVARVHALDGFFNGLFSRYYTPYAGDVPADLASKIIADGATLNFLPLRLPMEDGWTKYASKRQGITQIHGALVCAFAIILGWGILLALGSEPLTLIL